MPATGDRITKRKDGLYQGMHTIQTGSGPKRKYIYGRRKKDVQQKLAEAMGNAVRGIAFDSQGVTVETFLAHWLRDVIEPNKTHRTFATHRQQAETHIVPALGKIRLDTLRKSHIDWLYSDLLRKGLAASTVRRVHSVLHCALEEAVRGDLIPRNPASFANKPTVRQVEQAPLDASQVRRFLEVAHNDRFEALYILCVTAALRQGEALALRWSDIDLDARTLRVNRQLQRVRRDGNKAGTLEFSEPKNASRRTVGLPQKAITALRVRRSVQLKERIAAGPDWQDKNLVFTTATGGPLDAQNIVNRYFKPLLEKAELPSIRFHDLRHTCLSLLAQRGEPIRDLQALAGHATAAFTLQRYTHHYEASAQRTAQVMGDILAST